MEQIYWRWGDAKWGHDSTLLLDAVNEKAVLMLVVLA